MKKLIMMLLGVAFATFAWAIEWTAVDPNAKGVYMFMDPDVDHDYVAENWEYYSEYFTETLYSDTWEVQLSGLAGMCHAFDAQGSGTFTYTVNHQAQIYGTIIVTYDDANVTPGGAFKAYLVDASKVVDNTFDLSSMTPYQSGNFGCEVAPVKYMKWDESKKELVEATCTSYTVVTKDTTTLGDGWYVVNSTVSRGTIKVTGAAHLILCDGAKLTAATSNKYDCGIVLPKDKALTIYGQKNGTGTLEVTGGYCAAGIGSEANLLSGVRTNISFGTLTINGGKIKAQGGDFAAGIGGGRWCTNGVTITINGGDIEATGGKQGSGIGGGDFRDYTKSSGGTDTLTINGGKIKAVGGKFGTGIGSSNESVNPVAITINGGEIEAIGGQYGAGIGYGARATAGATININGGTITASTPEKINDDDVPSTADAIGKGYDSASAATVKFGSDVVFVIKAGADAKTAKETTAEKFAENHSAMYAKIESVSKGIAYLTWDETKKELVEASVLERDITIVTADTATFEDKKWYVVTNTIERGTIKVDGAAHLILCDGASLTVTGLDYEAGIEVPADKSLTIYGQSEGTGKLVANGLKGGAGIGGIYHGTCGTITINGGEINATGGDYGAGIGGSAGGSNGATITINGGTVKATGGLQGAGIGSGNYYDEHVGSRSDTDVIAINGGTITATGGQWGAGIGSGSDGFAATVTINGGTITASTVPDQGAEAIGSGDAAKAAATVTFGTAMASKYVWAGESATKGEMMTTTAFASDHSAVYAELPVETYTVAYDKNGAAGTMSNDVFAVSKEVTLKKNAFTALGYDFAGWTTNGTDVVYADEAKDTDFATTNATLTLYAKWNASTNSVTATDFSSFTNMLTTAKNQGTNLGVTIGFDSGVKLDGATITLPASGTTGFEGLKYEDSTKMWLEDGVLYADVLRGEVTTDALALMKLANGGTNPTAFKAITEGEGTSVTNDVIMLLGNDNKGYFNDENNVDEMINAVLEASPRPTTVKLFEVKEAIVSFDEFTGKNGVYEVNEGETAKIVIAGGSVLNAVEAKLYCVSKSAGAIKTTGGKYPSSLVYMNGKRINFPIDLKWEKGDTEPKVLEIVTTANKAVKPDRYVRLQLGAPVGCKIYSGSDYAQLTIKDGGADPRREVTASIYPAHTGTVSGMGFLKNEKSTVTLTAKPASFAKTATFKGWFKAEDGDPNSVNLEATPVSTELKFKVGFEDYGHYVAYFEDVLALPQAVAPVIIGEDGKLVPGVEGVVTMVGEDSILRLLVGANVSLPLSFSEETVGVKSVTAKGLPSGLKVSFDKTEGTYKITGKPTKIGLFTSTLTIKNAAGKSTHAVTFSVQAFPGSRAVGVLKDDRGYICGNIDMTIGKTGTVSAKINVGGGLSYSFSAKNLNYTCDDMLEPIITIDLTNKTFEEPLRLTWNSDEATFDGEFMGMTIKAIAVTSENKTVATYSDKIFNTDGAQVGTIKVVVKESGLATITGKIDGLSFSTVGYAEEADEEDYAYTTEFYVGSKKFYFFSESLFLFDEGDNQILGNGSYDILGGVADDVGFGKAPAIPPM